MSLILGGKSLAEDISLDNLIGNIFADNLIGKVFAELNKFGVQSSDVKT